MCKVKERERCLSADAITHPVRVRASTCAPISIRPRTKTKTEPKERAKPKAAPMALTSDLLFSICMCLHLKERESCPIELVTLSQWVVAMQTARKLKHMCNPKSSIWFVVCVCVYVLQRSS